MKYLVALLLFTATALPALALDPNDPCGCTAAGGFYAMFASDMYPSSDQRAGGCAVSLCVCVPPNVVDRTSYAQWRKATADGGGGGADAVASMFAIYHALHDSASCTEPTDIVVKK